MKTPPVRIEDCVLPTRQTDPRRWEGEFTYIDISSINRETKRIEDPKVLATADAPSRARKEVRKNDVLVSTVRPNLNAVAMVEAEPPRPIGSTGFTVLRPDPSKIHPRYLFFRVISEPFISDMVAQAKGAGYPAVSDRIVGAHEIPLPPLPEQNRIVEILDQADALRQQRRQADALSQRILPALFQEMFGDPNAAHEKWPSKGITEVCWPRQWPTISGKQLLPEGFPVFGANGLIGYYDSFNHEHPTIAITCRGATCGTINLTPPKCYITGNAMALDDLDESLVTQEFMIAFLECRGLGDVITGAAQPQITRSNLEKVKIPLVPTDLLARFSEASKSLTSARSKATTSAATLETLFQTLLHRAFDGSLTAKWREGEGKELLQEMKHQTKA